MDDKNIFVQSMEEVMHNSMMPYSEHVILDRSLPRAEDGLKPVQRRIIFSMNGEGITPDKPHRKCAKIVGEVLGKYHPHGDSSVYDALVRMAQPFNMGETLVDGHGNFGSVDGDSAAAMRYTEARLTPIALELIRDIEKDTVPFQFNYDDSEKEPEILPCGYPNLLVNGASGIAVGFATNIPTHNLSECIDGAIMRMEQPECSVEEMMKVIKGPDFPTGGRMYVNDELLRAYKTGKGRIILRAKIQIESLKNGKKNLVIHELPYQVNKALLLMKISKLREEKNELFPDIADIRDESDRDGMRAVIELKKDADVKATLNALYRHSDLQIGFSINVVAIAGGKPCQMGLLELLDSYIGHRRTVVTRRTQFDLDKAKAREHILSGLMIAVNDIDRVIALIKSSKTAKEAKEKLIVAFDFSEVQAQAVLDMRLQRLTSLQIDSLRAEFEQVQKLIAHLESILASKKKLDALIVKEMKQIKNDYGHPRLTEIIWDANPEIQAPVRKAVSEDAWMCVYADGGIKRTDKADEDAKYAVNLLSNEKVYVFTNAGSCYTLVPNDFTVARPKDRGVLLTSLFTGVEQDEEIVAVFGAMGEGVLQFYTANGMLKVSREQDYVSIKSKIAAIKLKDDDKVVAIYRGKKDTTSMLVTKKGMSIRFTTDEVNPIGRVSAGVKAIKLGLGDKVIFVQQVENTGEILVVTDRGYVKKTPVVEYDIQGKNGKGLKTFDFKSNKSNGQELVFVDYINEATRYTAVQKNGEATEFTSQEVVFESRYSKGSSVVMVLLDNVITQCARV